MKGQGMGMKPRIHLLSTVSALALAGSAFAADMPVKAPPRPAVVVAPTWSGFYVGGHGGVAWLRHKQNIDPFDAEICSQGGPQSLTETCSIKDTGVVAGGQIGYLWQYQQFVFGVEADGSWTGLKKSVSNDPFGGGFFRIVDDKVEWLTSVRGRLGFAVNDWLLYGTGGAAWAKVNAGWTVSPIQGGYSNRIDKTLSGWVAGGGIEKMVGRNWSVRAEYLYYDFRNVTTIFAAPFNNTYTTTFRHNVSVVRLGLNFRANP